MEHVHIVRYLVSDKFSASTSKIKKQMNKPETSMNKSCTWVIQINS